MTISMRRTARMLLCGLVGLLLAGLSCPALAATALQCVPYARMVSGVTIYGDALTWWDQAQDRYRRGHTPQKGAVLAFRPNGPMTLGHVAVVSRVVDDRQILVRHANWSAPGAIEEDVLAIDVSQAGDWSAVRVWHSPTGQMGARVNPTFGFIYPDKPHLKPFTPDDSLGSSIRMVSAPQSQQPPARQVHFASNSAGPVRAARNVRIDYDPAIIGDTDVRLAERSLRDIIEDVKRGVTAG